MTTLFDYVLVVRFKKGVGPQISYKFPQVIDVKDDIAAAAPSFCFPEGEGKSIQSTKETFSFTLTTGSGEKRFGYCRRFVSDSEPECYCIVSQFSSFSLFSVILDIVEERRKYSSSAVFTFLKSVVAQNIPSPGSTIKISTFSATGASQPDQYELTIPIQNDYLLDYVSYKMLFKCLDVKQIISLFECLLLESRVIFVSKKLSKLSECVNAAVALLNPFSWQYVFIPVLPTSLLGYCCAPMPFVVGITSNSLPELAKLPTEEFLMIDLDKGSFTSVPSTRNILDDSMREHLENSLHKVKSACKIGDKSFDLNVARCFCTVIFRYCGYYKLFLSSKGFKKDEFLESQPPHYYQTACSIVESQMWSVFLHEREELLRQGKIDSCLLVKTGHNLWHSTDLSVVCGKCGTSSTHNVHVHHGKVYCSACFEFKKDRLGKLKKLTTFMKRNGSGNISLQPTLEQSGPEESKPARELHSASAPSKPPLNRVQSCTSPRSSGGGSAGKMAAALDLSTPVILPNTSAKKNFNPSGLRSETKRGGQRIPGRQQIPPPNTQNKRGGNLRGVPRGNTNSRGNANARGTGNFRGVANASGNTRVQSVMTGGPTSEKLYFGGKKPTVTIPTAQNASRPRTKTDISARAQAYLNNANKSG